jgi:hypothetical protein
MTTSIEITRAGAIGQMPVETDLIFSATVAPSVGVNGVTDPAITPAQAVQQLFCTVTCDENIFVQIGAVPDATTTPRRMMAAGQSRSFAIASGQKVAVAGR